MEDTRTRTHLHEHMALQSSIFLALFLYWIKLTRLVPETKKPNRADKQYKLSNLFHDASFIEGLKAKFQQAQPRKN